MNLEAAREIFAVRFYRWALQDFYREIQLGLPLIASIKGGTATRFIEIWETLSKDVRTVLPLAFVKYAHTRAVAITGEYLTPSESEVNESYRKLAREHSELEQEVWRRRLAGQGRVKKVDGRKFTRRVKQELRPVVGEHWQFSYSTDTKYLLDMDPWTVYTWAHTGQPATYDQGVVAAGHEHVYLWERTCLFSWLGIPGQFFWDLMLDDDDADAAAISIGVLCGHFVAAVRGLLDGLSHDVPDEPPKEPPPPPAIRLVKKNRQV